MWLPIQITAVDEIEYFHEFVTVSQKWVHGKLSRRKIRPDESVLWPMVRKRLFLYDKHVLMCSSPAPPPVVTNILLFFLRIFPAEFITAYFCYSSSTDVFFKVWQKEKTLNTNKILKKWNYLNWTKSTEHIRSFFKKSLKHKYSLYRLSWDEKKL